MDLNQPHVTPLLGEGTEKIRCTTVRVSPHPRTLHEQGGDKRKGALVPEWQDKQNGMDWPRAGKGSLPRVENVSRQKDCEPIGGSPHGMNFTKNWLQACSIVVQGDNKQTIQMPILPDGAKPPWLESPALPHWPLEGA